MAKWITDTHAQQWLLAAESIRALLELDAATRDIKVEIIAWPLLQANDMQIVEPEHPIVAIWPSLNPRIHDVIDNSPRLRDNWKSIDVLRLGKSNWLACGSSPVTVSIIVDWNLDRHDWIIAELRIKCLLVLYDLSDVRICIERGDVDPSSDEGRFDLAPRLDQSFWYPKEAYNQRVPMGSDFGPSAMVKNEVLDTDDQLSLDQSGTIGGYLEFCYDDGSHRQFAMTTYSCVREMLSPGKQRERTDVCGTAPDSIQQISRTFQSPAARNHGPVLQYICKRIHDCVPFMDTNPKNFPQKPYANTEEVMALQNSYFDKQRFFFEGRQYLGHVHMCSGYSARTSNNSRVDIALLSINPDRLGDNTIPEKIWRGPEPSPLALGSLLQGLASLETKTKSETSRVFLVGARGGAIVGNMNSIKSDIRTGYDRKTGMGHTSEYTMVTHPDSPKISCIRGGDSGAVVFDHSGSWVGIAWGGQNRSQVRDTSLCYITSSEEALMWINDIGRREGQSFEARLEEGSSSR
ncbi:MAG: hypothetical protein Q9218_008265 [Villophora microphyllina]